jgi:large subunit ribosomal protein L13
MKTYNAKPGEIARDWYVVDAEGKTLGRLATTIADTLRGKNKPQYTPHVDTGDFVVVVNAERVHVTGNKLDQPVTGIPATRAGSGRTLRAADRRPTEVLRKAVRGCSRNRPAVITKLKIYAGPTIRTRRRRPPLPLEDLKWHKRKSRNTREPASGRRRSLVGSFARDGATWFNGRTIEEYFRARCTGLALAPLKVARLEGYDIARVHGGGPSDSGRGSAWCARAPSSSIPSCAFQRAASTRDARIVERKKAGLYKRAAPKRPSGKAALYRLWVSRPTGPEVAGAVSATLPYAGIGA